MSTKERYERVRAEVDLACEKAGRDPHEVLLLAVSKTVDLDQVQEAIEGGAHAFGENRPDELLRKQAIYPDVRWHFIGNIQSRRIPDIVYASSLIHSLYQMKHALKIDQAASEIGKVQDVLIEVNVSGEASKSGVTPEDAPELVKQVSALPNVRVRGLMTMAPQGDRARARACFEDLFALANTIRSELPEEEACTFDQLSAGMSEDWQEAVAAGSTIVRIGRAIFSDDFV